MRPDKYRFQNETFILWVTITIILIVTLLTATFSLCLIPLILIGILLIAYWQNKVVQQSLARESVEVSIKTLPALENMVEICKMRLGVENIKCLVTKGREINAYTFGFSNPKTVVFYDGIIRVMDRDEMLFVIGHELGHVALGHTLLNTLLGGMAGVPSSLGAAVLFILAFRWWNRACEYSADRAGLLACGSVEKSISALVKLVSGKFSTKEEFEKALQVIDQEDDEIVNSLAETLNTHPMIIKRIEELKRFATTREYLELKSRIHIEQNIFVDYNL